MKKKKLKNAMDVHKKNEKVAQKLRAVRQRADIQPTREFVIFGDLHSKSNSRRLVSKKVTVVKNGRKSDKSIPMFIKSQAALDWTDSAIMQMKTKPDDTIEIECGIDVAVYYSSNRHDLDPALLLDAMQKAGVIRNDRLLVYILARKFIDPVHPRIIVRVFAMPDGPMIPAIPVYKKTQPTHTPIEEIL